MALDRWNGIEIIGDETPERDFMRTDVSYGLVPRDYSVDPLTMFAPPSDIALVPESEIEARIKEQEELKSSLEHIWKRSDGGKEPPWLDQNGIGYCWSHSTTHAVMMARAAANMPYVPLSAYMVGCIVKKYRDQGGWCGQSAAFIAEHGVCSQEFWPQQDMSRRHDTPEMRANAKLHRIVEEWRDLTRPIYGQVLTWQQVITCGLLNQPMACDFNWWGHSVCGVRPVVVERGDIGLMILNSHPTSGFLILRGRRARPDNAIAIRTVTASAA